MSWTVGVPSLRFLDSIRVLVAVEAGRGLTSGVRRSSSSSMCSDLDSGMSFSASRMTVMESS